MSVVVQTGLAAKSMLIELAGSASPTTATDMKIQTYSAGQIMSNDKFSLTSIISSQGGSIFVPYIEVFWEASTIPTAASMELVLFTNKDTDTLGLASGATFVYDGTNNIISDGTDVAIPSAAFATHSSTSLYQKVITNLIIKAKTDTATSLSGALKTNDTPVVSASTAIKIKITYYQLQ